MGIIHHMVNNVIQLRGLTVVRSGRPVLDGLDLEIGAGVTGLLGPSGCGKSTPVSYTHLTLPTNREV